MNLNTLQIKRGYLQLLEREPSQHELTNAPVENLHELYRYLCSLDEFKHKVWKYRFFAYAANFDAIKQVLDFSHTELKPIQHYLINFIGVGFPLASLPLQNPPEIEDLPIPANWHTDLTELGSALHAVTQCANTFSMVELGAGIGVWSNICGRAAKMRGLKVKLLGIEGDKNHVDVAEKTLITNCFEKNEYRMLHGIVANQGNVALFRKNQSSQIDWGGEPIYDYEGVVFEEAKKSGKYESVPVRSLDSLISAAERIDLLHVDIQGGEETLFINNECLLNKKVKSIIIGTHSRIIEGKLFDYFQHLGWSLEAERPLIGSIENEGLRTIVDGVQYWKNKKSN